MPSRANDSFVLRSRTPCRGGGGARILIEKTYEDAPSYHGDPDGLLFDRPLGIKRNAVVLPLGYELVSCNYPSQVLEQPDGRIKIAFWNDTPAPAPLVLHARKTSAMAPHHSLIAASLDERAHQSRNIVYYLKAPETHSFALTHDYTEERPGADYYVNIVRAGSAVSHPTARDLDSDQALQSELVRGDRIKQLEPEAKDISADTSAVVFRFLPVSQGGSRRLRFSETYTDEARYGMIDGELVWHRSLGRAENAIVLPTGWSLTNSSVPATVRMMDDGRIRLDFINPRTDEIDTIITAHRRK